MHLKLDKMRSLTLTSRAILGLSTHFGEHRNDSHEQLFAVIHQVVVNQRQNPAGIKNGTALHC